MKNILQTYEAASDQAINLAKSEVFYCKNVPLPQRNMISSTLGVTKDLGSGKYLGIPSLIGRSRRSVFGYIRDRVWKKIQIWNGKNLSRAGKEVLIKSFLQPILSYCMSAFLLPESIGDEIQRKLNSFYWGSGQRNRRGINWMSWMLGCLDSLCGIKIQMKKFILFHLFK